MAAGLGTAGCHGHEDAGDGPQADEYIVDCENNPTGATVFATDESFAEFVNKEAGGGLKVDEANAPKLIAPAPGSSVSIAEAPTFTFAMGTVGALTPAPATGPVKTGRTPRPRWAAVRKWFRFEGTAHAHCAAVTGDNTLFRVTKVNDKKALYTAMLSVTTFTPNQAKWAAALAGQSGQMIEVTVARAVYSKGSITLGPFVSATPFRFPVAP